MTTVSTQFPIRFADLKRQQAAIHDLLALSLPGHIRCLLTAYEGQIAREIIQHERV